MKSALLFLLFTLSALNANAQLGDLFKKITENIESVAKEIENKNKLQEGELITSIQNMQGKALSIDDVSQLKGRWSWGNVCNVVDKKIGAYLSENNEGNLIVSNYLNSNELTRVSTVKKIEQFEINKKTIIKLTGTYKDKKEEDDLDFVSIWDITDIKDNKVLIVDSIWNGKYAVKNYIDTDTNKKLEYLEKCYVQNVIRNAKNIDVRNIDIEKLIGNSVPEKTRTTNNEILMKNFENMIYGFWSENKCQEWTGIHIMRGENNHPFNYPMRSPTQVNFYGINNLQQETLGVSTIGWEIKNGKLIGKLFESDKSGALYFEYVSPGRIRVEKFSLLVADSMGNKQIIQLIENGRIIQSNRKVNDFIKCDFSEDSAKADKSKTFGIKDLTLDSIPPPIGSDNEVLCKPEKYYVKTKLVICSYKTTLLEIPFSAHAVIHEDKIIQVVFMDDLFESESADSYNRNIWDRNKIIAKLKSIKDFSAFSNDLIKLIEEKINVKPEIKIKSANSMELLNYTLTNAIIQSKEQSKKEEGIKTNKAKQSLNTYEFYLNALKRQCETCKSKEYSFIWKQQNYGVNVGTIVPESKEHPYPFYGIIINYSLINADKKIASIKDLVKTLDFDAVNQKNQKEQNLDKEKNEKRKKDF